MVIAKLVRRQLAGKVPGSKRGRAGAGKQAGGDTSPAGGGDGAGGSGGGDPTRVFVFITDDFGFRGIMGEVRARRGHVAVVCNPGSASKFEGLAAAVLPWTLVAGGR